MRVMLMKLEIQILDDVLRQFPDLRMLVREVTGVQVTEGDHRLEVFKEEVYADVRRKFTLEGLKDDPLFRAYRDFFWSMGIDPTKVRPASEALVRRVVRGRRIPRINAVVDAYNLASLTTGVALAAFDIDRVEGDICMRFANTGEAFLGIGMDEPVRLTGGEVVLSDASRLLAIYPHRDAEYSQITLETKNLILVSCGAPQIPIGALREAAERAYEFVIRFCCVEHD